MWCGMDNMCVVHGMCCTGSGTLVACTPSCIAPSLPTPFLTVGFDFKTFAPRDGDGHLTAEELVAALNTHGVDITLEQADIIIQAVDTDDNGTIELEEFPQLIYGLAALDRASNERTAAGESGG